MRHGMGDSRTEQNIPVGVTGKVAQREMLAAGRAMRYISSASLVIKGHPVVSPMDRSMTQRVS